MQGDPEIIQALNEILTAELTAINQYFVHYKMCENWGYKRLAKAKYDESIGEMKDAEEIIARILYLEGTPNMQRLNPVRVGEDALEQNRLDLEMERDAVERYNRAVALCRERGDHGSRALLERILQGEEAGVDWLEAQVHLAEELGKAHYLSEQVRE